MKNMPQIQELLAPNLVPMIDIMFLLLVFFMLGADMSQRQFEEVRLPNSSQATPDRDQDRLLINAHHRIDAACTAYDRHTTCRDAAHWKLAIQARDVTDPADLAAALQRETASTRHLDPAGRPISERRVMIRADAAAPYALAQRAMNACAEQGIYRIQVGAATPAAH